MPSNLSLPDGTAVERLFCIGCNYDEHIKELGSTDADRCIIFMKPPSCLAVAGTPLAIPRDKGAVHHEVELVVAIGRGGFRISEEDALRHIGAITLGVDLTLRDLQNRLKRDGHPWELCKAFEQSAPIGEFVPWNGAVDLAAIELRCIVNGEVRQAGNTRDMLFSVPRLISVVSQTWRLMPGDLIFTGTPPGVGPLNSGDTLTVASPQIGEFSWKIV